MSYILFTGENENRKVLALIQGPKQADWDQLYRQFAESSGVPYEES